MVKYRWFKWRHQPALAQLHKEFPEEYSDAVLDALQVRVEAMHTSVGRCKLDPSLNAPSFKTLIVKMMTIAFNLNLDL